ncbi:pentatricopeptide repeat-containing protein At4g32430, mitochondrial [Euphorbia lathyris]|uniref:pentatricopeptide repeat-containing protein At4g32430, mitochondrial n=1 Tax=Euphorbia lathyris TaxID=212925 RepID=UPI003314471E
MFTCQRYCSSLCRIGKQESWLRNFYTESNACQLLVKSCDPNDVSIRSSMLNAIHKNLPFRALQIFKKRIQLGFMDDIDQVTVSLALKACCGNPFIGFQLHALSITSGFTSHIIVPNALMNMYCKSGYFDQALRIFNNLIDPDIVSWNTMLSGFQRSDDALNFARKLNSTGISFDPVTYTTVLAFCSRNEEFLFGLQLHSCILKVGLECEVFVGNALITMYARWGRLQDARKVFDEMPTRDCVSWNAMISGYTKEGIYGREAVEMFIQMVRRGIKLDHVSFTSAVSACGHDKNLQLGRQLHGLTIKRGYDKHVSVGNVLISTYSKCEATKDAKLAFQNMDERNVVSWTTMISIDEENAVPFFNQMRSQGVYPNNVTFIGLIHAITIRNLSQSGKTVHGLCIKSGFSVENSFITMYAKFGSMQESVRVFEELNYREIITWNALVSGYAQNALSQEAICTFYSALVESKPNEYTFGSVLSAIGCAEDVSLKHGERCHSHIIKSGLNTNPIVSSALLDMYAKRGSICDSEKVFSEGPERSQFAWTAIISAYARHGDYESVMSWFEKMEKEGVRPDSITFLSVIAACGRKGMVDMGQHLFDSMVKDYNIEPSSEHYSCMVDMLGRAGRLKEAEEVVNRIPGKAGLSVLQSLLGACRMHGNVEMGEKVADGLIGMEPSESGSYVLMSNMYAERGEWEQVAKLRRGMREKGVKKQVGLSWADVGHINASMALHAFSSGDNSHPQSHQIRQVATSLGAEMTFLRSKFHQNFQFFLMIAH